jgi:hypothetical protein
MKTKLLALLYVLTLTFLFFLIFSQVGCDRVSDRVGSSRLRNVDLPLGETSIFIEQNQAAPASLNGPPVSL